MCLDTYTSASNASTNSQEPKHQLLKHQLVRALLCRVLKILVLALLHFFALGIRLNVAIAIHVAIIVQQQPRLDSDPISASARLPSPSSPFVAASLVSLHPPTC